MCEFSSDVDANSGFGRTVSGSHPALSLCFNTSQVETPETQLRTTYRRSVADFLLLNQRLKE